MPRRNGKTDALRTDRLRDLFDQHRIESGSRARARRKALKLTQGQIAAFVGVQVQTISKIERGDILPRDYLKAALAVALVCEIEDLWPYPTRLSIAQVAA